MAKEPFAASLTAIWIGGFFFWILTGLRGKYVGQLTSDKENRNIIVGYILQMVVLGFVIYFFYVRVR
jgi:hypothetical protein